MMSIWHLKALLILMLPICLLALEEGTRGHAFMHTRATLVYACIFVLPLQQFLKFLLTLLQLVCLTLIKLLFERSSSRVLYFQANSIGYMPSASVRYNLALCGSTNIECSDPLIIHIVGINLS